MADQNVKSTRITVSLGKEPYDSLREYASTQDASISWVVRRAIAEFLTNHDMGAQQELPLGRTEYR
jgi:predicted transcriptional regulator